MANTKTFYMAGQVQEISEVTDIDDKKSVINMTISFAKDVFGIKSDVEQRVVMFGRKAREVAAKLKEGDFALLTNCKRSPREFVTGSGTIVQTVDVIAEGFTKVSRAQFDKSWPEIEEAMPPASAFEFSDDDAKELARRAELLAAGEDDGDDADI